MKDGNKTSRIVHINTNDIKGGAAKFVWRLWEAQKKKGIDTKFIVGIKESESPDIIQFPAKADIRVHNKCLEKGLLYYDLKGSHKLVEYPVIEKADLIHLHNIHGGYFNPFSMSALSIIKPLVWTLHDMNPFTGHCVFSFDCNNWERGCKPCQHLDYPVSLSCDSASRLLDDKALIYKHSILNIVTPTKWMQDRVEKSVLKQHNIRTIYHGIDMNIFKPADKGDIRRKLGIPVDKVVIGSVANGGAFGDPRKGGYYIGKCIEALDCSNIDYMFVNIGSGNTEGSGNARIINTGYITDEVTLAEYYSSLDIFLFPSLAESFGLVVLEALACGVPVVAFDYGAIGEIVRDGMNGIIVDYKNEQMLVKAVLDLVGDKARCMVYSRNAADSTRMKFSFDSMQNEYDKLYSESIDGFENRRPKQTFFDFSDLPDEVLCDNFLRLEGYKDKTDSFLIEKSKTEPKVSIIYDGVQQQYCEAETYRSLVNQTYKNKEIIVATDEDIDIAAIQCDLIYYVDEGYILEPDSIEKLINYYSNEEAVCFQSELIRIDGTAFYKAGYPDINIEKDDYQINLGKHNGIIFRRDYFAKNIDKLRTHSYCTIKEVDFLNYKLSKVSLKAYISNIIAHRASERNYIYGAGGHTKDLISYIDTEKINICGIFDRNPDLRGKRLDNYEVFSYEEMSTMEIDNIIISSAIYEQEIFDQLKCKFAVEKLIRIYGGVY